MKIRDRIKSFRRVKASELLPNPRNWRRHPDAQRQAMRALLAEIGFAGATLARETEAGLEVIDGHLRAEESGDAKIPVLVLDVTTAEADKLLATFDPVGKMAEADPEALGKLLAEIDTESEALQMMLDELAEKVPEPCEQMEPPETVQNNLDELQRLHDLRSKGNRDMAGRNDTEIYLVVVFPSRQSRERAVVALGLPPDERYVAASDVRLTRRLSGRPAVSTGLGKSADSKNSGACG